MENKNTTLFIIITLVAIAVIAIFFSMSSVLYENDKVNITNTNGETTLEANEIEDIEEELETLGTIEIDFSDLEASAEAR